jgi:hypothetical protein
MSLNGFAGTISLTTNPSSGLTATLAASSLTLSANGFNSTTLSVSATVAGTYTVTVTGTSGIIQHTTAMITVIVTTPTFTISCSPASITFTAGQTGNCTITVTPQNGFSGTVTLTTQASAGITATLSTNTINTSGSSLLTVSGTTNGNFNVNVTGTSNTTPVVIQTVQVPVTVTSGAQQPVFIQVNWRHHFSLSKYANTQTFKLGVLNPNNATTLYVNFQINLIDGSGTNPITANSGVIALSPLQSTSNNQVKVSFGQANIGETWTFTAVIQWGTSPTALTNISTATQGGVPTSGSFTVLP